MSQCCFLYLLPLIGILVYSLYVCYLNLLHLVAVVILIHDPDDFLINSNDLHGIISKQLKINYLSDSSLKQGLNEIKGII
jgi:hypothetical protein